MINGFALPKHISFTLEHNDHKNYYSSIQYEVNNGEYFGWISEEEKQLAIDNDEVWTAIWYPDTPIGSNKASAYNLNKLLDYIKP